MNARRIEAFLFWWLATLLVWAPIPLGSNRGWAWAGLEIGVFALLAAWLLYWAWRGETPVAVRKAWLAWLLLGAWVGLHILHVLPLPQGVVALLSPTAAEVQRSVAELGLERNTWTLSVDAYASRVSILKTLAYCSVFFLTLALVNTRGRVLAIALVIVYSGVAHSIYAVLMHLAEVKVEYLGLEFSHGDSASGTYANRNHFAGYLEMVLAVGIGLLIAGLSDRSADTWKRFVRLTIEWILSPKMLLRLSLCILVIALTTTHSRTGNTAFFASLLIAGVIGIALSRHGTRNTVILLASLVVIDLLIVGSWFGVQKLAERIEQTTIQDIQDREDPAQSSLALIRAYPMFGSGPGTFYIVFPRYRQEKVTAYFQHAHNDYAEFTSDTGLLGLAILGSFVASTLGVALRAQWRRRDPLMRGMSFACIMGTVAILIHSWTDFNLQIPANAMLFMAVLALGWISLFMDRVDPGAPKVRIGPA